MTKELSLFSTEKKVPAFLANEKGATGNENVGAEDLAIPQLKILQPLSPELMMNIEGAKAGMFINSVTHAVADEMYVINLRYDHNFGIFRKRTMGGGKMGQASTMKDAHQLVSELPGNVSDYDIIDTGIHGLLKLKEDGTSDTPMLLYCSGTKKTVSQNWNTQIQLQCAEFDVPRYATVWLLTMVTEKNAKGTWYNFRPEFAGVVTNEELYAEARDMRGSLDQRAEFLAPPALTAS